MLSTDVFLGILALHRTEPTPKAPGKRHLRHWQANCDKIPYSLGQRGHHQQLQTPRKDSRRTCHHAQSSTTIRKLVRQVLSQRGLQRHTLQFRTEGRYQGRADV